MVSKPQIIPLSHAAADTGGKAAGLARLCAMELRVPEGFVLVGASPGQRSPGLEQAFRALGGAVAVRSSASDEDAVEASFAGQYATVLNVRDESELHAAVDRCLLSLESAEAGAYRRERATEKAHRSMAVVIQRMVEARTAGVLFTADPVTARRDTVVVDAVAGIGEALVSGHAAPDHYLLNRDGELRRGRVIQQGQPLLTQDQLRRLTQEALDAERRWGCPLDLEWAFDASGELYWLQSRPITTLVGDLNEFDTPARPTEWFTLANIGEMIPGAVCPLDLSTIVVGIDHGIQHMLVVCGVQPRIEPRLQVVGQFYGHLFFNLSAMFPFCSKVGGSSPEQLMYAICGRVIEELVGDPPASPVKRAVNGARYLYYVLSGEAEVQRLTGELLDFQILPGADAEATYGEIDRHLPRLMETYRVHIQSSAGSGFTSGVLQGVLAKGHIPTAAQEAQLAEMLAGASGVESADLVTELDHLARLILEQGPALTTAEPAEALAWLRRGDALRVGDAFNSFLRRHGHRALRELSLRQKGWADDPIPLVRALQAGSAMSGRAHGRGQEGSPGGKGSLPMRGLLAWSQRTVRRRERSKSMLVDVTDRFKKAYRHLARQLVECGDLPDEDALFFLTHQELGSLVAGRLQDTPDLVGTRRAVFAGQQGLRFSTVFTGVPQPLDPQDELSREGEGKDQLTGQPVSCGVVEGPARVAITVEQAAGLKPGEILIAPVTDVGWAPYFRIIGGLATDVGSAISHGAVVAREYGLPAVVNLGSATRVFRTGDQVRLDADRGTLTRL